MKKFSWLVLVAFLAIHGVHGGPFNPEETVLRDEASDEGASITTTEETPEGNNSAKDLYVIRKVVYEIGILTNADNSTEFDNKTHEQIDVSFFDPADNGTFIDLSNIPFPVETNVSGVALTGILPSNFGNLVFPQNGDVASLNESSLPVFPDKQVKVTKSISTVDKEKSEHILSGISDVLGLSRLVSPERQESENKLSR